jgi:hypothetical protein
VNICSWLLNLIRSFELTIVFRSGISGDDGLNGSLVGRDYFLRHVFNCGVFCGVDNGGDVNVRNHRVNDRHNDGRNNIGIGSHRLRDRLGLDLSCAGDEEDLEDQ